MTIKNALKLEELFMFIIAFLGFIHFGGAWWAFFLVLLIPDVSMIGYVVSPLFGSYTYNIIHHKGFGIIVFLVGYYLKIDLIILSGIILFAHSSMDRIFGYGLKYRDNFNNTHLGLIKKE